MERGADRAHSLRLLSTQQSWSIRLLGEFALGRAGQILDTSQCQQRPLALLRLVAAHGGKVARDVVIDLLWPDSAPEAGATNLRGLVYRLRQFLVDDPPPVLLQGGWVVLNPALDWEIDLIAFEQAVQSAGNDAALLQSALARFVGEPLVEDRYEDWAVHIRERVQRTYREGVLRLVGLLRSQGDGADALPWLERLLVEDPLDETVFRLYLLTMSDVGRRGDIRREFARFAQRLHAELNAGPEEETVLLAQRLMQMQPEIVPMVPATPPQSKNLRSATQRTPLAGRRLESTVSLGVRNGTRLVTVTGLGGDGTPWLAVALMVVLVGGFAVFSTSRLAGNKALPTLVLAGRPDPNWPLRSAVPGTLSNPSAVAVDASGTIYVADAGSDQVDHFSSSGRFLGAFGSTGTHPGQFRQPRGIVVDRSGDVYVSDTGNDRIQKFSSTGRWLASWSGPGSRPGQLRSPGGLAMDSSGNVYVADRDNNRIEEFSPSGAFLRAWGPGISTGPDEHAPPDLFHPEALALDQAGNMYVVDDSPTHLHEFSPDAAPLGDWGTTGSGFGRLTDPTSIVVERDGTVVVGQRTGSPMVEYAAYSHNLLAWHLRAKAIHVTGIALGSHGAFVVAGSGSARVLTLDHAGRVTGRLGRLPIDPAGLKAPGSLAVGPGGALYVADIGHRRVVRLEPDGRPVAQFGRGVIGFPRSVAVAYRSGDVYVLDPVLGRVERFSAAGKRLTSWGGFGDPRAIAVDVAGNVYVTDDTAGTIQKFTASGAPITAWTIAPPDISNGIGPIAIDRHGSLYVGVPGQGSVLRFSSNGRMIGEWAHFHGAIAVATDRFDNVYVADNGRLDEISPVGRVLRSVRLPESARGVASSAMGIAVDSRFDVFVSDATSHRILKFSPTTST